MATAKARVLVVDDNPGTLATYARILSIDGYEVATASGGCEGLALIRSRRFDLVLTDERMPDFSGLELLVEVQEMAAALPVVLYTALGSYGMEVAARRLGAVDFSAGLWDADELLRLVAKYTTDSDHLAPAGPTPKPGPATRRLVSLLVAISEFETDVPTVKAWASEFRISLSTIKRFCGACDVHPADALDLARGIRVVRLHAGQRMHRWYDTLEISDPETMDRFLARAGFQKDVPVHSLRKYLRAQTFIVDILLLKAVEAVLTP